MTTLILIALAALSSPLVGQVLRWYDQATARRLAEEARISAPLPAERVSLTGIQGIEIGTRWPQRQTPTDLADAYVDLPAPRSCAPAAVTTLQREPCNEPCNAKHCPDHAGVSGFGNLEAQANTMAAHAAWNTDTAEMLTLLGLAPVDVEWQRLGEAGVTLGWLRPVEFEDVT